MAHDSSKETRGNKCTTNRWGGDRAGDAARRAAGGLRLHQGISPEIPTLATFTPLLPASGTPLRPLLRGTPAPCALIPASGAQLGFDFPKVIKAQGLGPKRGAVSSRCPLFVSLSPAEHRCPPPCSSKREFATCIETQPKNQGLIFLTLGSGANCMAQ